MQITIEIPDQVIAKAANRGISIQDYVREILDRETPPSPTEPKLKTHEEIRRWLDNMARFSDSIPELPDEALTREGIYQDHD